MKYTIKKEARGYTIASNEGSGYTFWAYSTLSEAMSDLTKRFKEEEKKNGSVKK